MSKDIRNRHSYNFSLKPKTDAGGNVRISSDNIAAGFVICLMGLLAGGIAIAAFGMSGDAAERPERDRKPFQSANVTVGKSWEEIDAMKKEFGLDAESPAPAASTAKDESRGIAGKSLSFLVMKHGFAALCFIAAFGGIRILFTGTTISIDPQKSRVQWTHKGSFRASSEAYPFPRVNLVLHETVVWQSRHLDWHGFAASLVNSDSGAIQLARSKTMEGVRQYAHEFEQLTGIEGIEIRPEEAQSYGLVRWRPFSLRNGWPKPGSGDR